jgi:hypothetical protein
MANHPALYASAVAKNSPMDEGLTTQSKVRQTESQITQMTTQFGPSMIE